MKIQNMTPRERAAEAAARRSHAYFDHTQSTFLPLLLVLIADCHS